MDIKYVFKAIVGEIKTIFGDKSKDKVYSSYHKYDNQDDARKAYDKAVEKLFNVDRWSKLPGASSEFQLHSSSGQRKRGGTPVRGDFIRILLPGPLPENWVVVTNIKTEDNLAEFTVSPNLDPQESDQDIEHFFSDEATSTFRVELEGNSLRAFEIGKNEGINNKGKDAGNRNVLNTMLAEGGWAGFQKIQWEKLTDYLTHKEEAQP